MVMQKVKVAPKNVLTLRCDNKAQGAKERWESLDLTFIDSMNWNHTKTIDFCKAFQSNMKILFPILDKYPSLADDFQILVDPTGAFFQFDLDRAFQTPFHMKPEGFEWMSKNSKEPCKAQLKKRTIKLLARL